MLNPSLLKRIERTASRYEFADPNQKQSWVMWLRQPDDLELDFAADIEANLVAQFVTGGWHDAKGKYHEKPDLYHTSTGEVLIVSKSALRVASRLEVMQDAPEGEAEYTTLQILELIPFFPVAWGEIQKVFVDLITLPKGEMSDTKAS